MTACVGLCAAFAAEAEKLPQRLYQSPLTRFWGAFGGQKSPVQNQSNQTGSPDRPKGWISPENRGQHRGAKRSRRKTWRFMRQAGHFHPQCGRIFQGSEWRCSLLPHSQMTLFSLEWRVSPIGKAFCRTLPGFSGHANDNIPITLPRRSGYSSALLVCCVVGRRRWIQSVRICAA